MCTGHLDASYALKHSVCPKGSSSPVPPVLSLPLLFPVSSPVPPVALRVKCELVHMARWTLHLSPGSLTILTSALGAPAILKFFQLVPSLTSEPLKYCFCLGALFPFMPWPVCTLSPGLYLDISSSGELSPMLPGWMRWSSCVPL